MANLELLEGHCAVRVGPEAGRQLGHHLVFAAPEGHKAQPQHRLCHVRRTDNAISVKVEPVSKGIRAHGCYQRSSRPRPFLGVQWVAVLPYQPLHLRLGGGGGSSDG